MGARRYAKEELSDDEFELEMESELMCVMKTMASPSALVATQPGRKGEAIVCVRVPRMSIYCSGDGCTVGCRVGGTVKRQLFL